MKEVLPAEGTALLRERVGDAPIYLDADRGFYKCFGNQRATKWGLLNKGFLAALKRVNKKQIKQTGGGEGYFLGGTIAVAAAAAAGEIVYEKREAFIGDTVADDGGRGLIDSIATFRG